jgi:hypothetical protein
LLIVDWVALFRAVTAALLWHMGLVGDALTMGHYLTTVGRSSPKPASLSARLQQALDTAYSVCPPPAAAAAASWS